LEGEYSEEEGNENGDQYMLDEEELENLQPSIKDPRLWQIRVKRGLEKQVCMSLINKSIDFAKKGQPLAILSATCTDNVEGYIYIEAFKEIHVREAIKGLSAVLGGNLSLVELSEMTGIYGGISGFNEKKRTQLRKHQWVRIKNGLYNGDLGLVEENAGDKVWLRVIPRLDMKPKKNDKDSLANKFASQRPFAKPFNKDEAIKINEGPLDIKTISDL
jgi:transcription elongation factor SPT5